jgi:dihydroorotate dehydrogenase (fumarate)
MANLNTTYAGLKLKNPLIIGSNSFTANIHNLKEFERLGASAIVLKSIFEEEITHEFNKVIDEVDTKGETDQHIDYFDKKIKQDNLTAYIELIKDAKKELNIPIIASINCISLHEWLYFVQKIEEAGADAIELNIFYFPADFKNSAKKIEKRYIKIIKKVKESANIPIIVKMSQYFTNLGEMILKVDKTGVDGITLFNRFFRPDIHLASKEIITASVFSHPKDYLIPLQWVALMEKRTKAPMAASTGIHNGESFVKLLMSGASANYIVSSLFLNGFEVIEEMLAYLNDYLDKNNYKSVNDIIGMLSQENIDNPKYYERAQFMQYFTDNKAVRKE